MLHWYFELSLQYKIVLLSFLLNETNEKFPHFGLYQCFTNNTTSTILYFNSTIIGPIANNTSFSYQMTSSLSNNTYTGWVYNRVTDSSIILIVIIALVVIFIYNRVSLHYKYYNYILDRQCTMKSQMKIMTEELNKRDIITMNLIKLCQKKYQ